MAIGSRTLTSGDGGDVLADLARTGPCQRIVATSLHRDAKEMLDSCFTMSLTPTADFSVVDPYRMVRADKGVSPKGTQFGRACTACTGQYQRNRL